MAGGALANLADRSLDGSVVDFIDIGPWPTFNLADVAIVVGAVLVGWAARPRPDSPSFDAPEGPVLENSSSGPASPSRIPTSATPATPGADRSR